MAVSQFAKILFGMQDAPVLIGLSYQHIADFLDLELDPLTSGFMLATSPRSVIMTMRPPPMMVAISLCRSNKGYLQPLDLRRDRIGLRRLNLGVAMMASRWSRSGFT